MIIKKNYIPKQLELHRAVHDSLRGKYRIVDNFRYFEFDTDVLHHIFTYDWSEGYLQDADRFKALCELECELFKAIFENPGDKTYIEQLRKHPFWEGDESHLLDGYIKLHVAFQKKMAKSKYNSSRNTVAAVAETCVSLLQRHANTLYCVSRSCDISLGYYADLYMLYKYAVRYNLEKVVWHITTPHVYTNNIALTVKQFAENRKINKGMNFNKRENK